VGTIAVVEYNEYYILLYPLILQFTACMNKQTLIKVHINIFTYSRKYD